MVSGKQLWLTQLARFLQVGAVGFVADAGVLWTLIETFGAPPIAARVVSFLVAVVVTYMLNRRYTFQVERRPGRRRRYSVVQALGWGLNFGSYTLLVLVFAATPLLALCVGSALGSSSNFVLMRRFVFHH